MSTTPEGLQHLWPDTFTRSFPVWGKATVLRALDNIEVEQINHLVAQIPPENQRLWLAIYTVAASIVSVGDEVVCALEGDKEVPLPFAARIEIVRPWDDALTNTLFEYYERVVGQYRAALEGITDPN